MFLSPLGQAAPNPDPWAQGPSFQYAFPVTTPKPVVPFNPPAIVPAPQPQPAPSLLQLPMMNFQQPSVNPTPEVTTNFPAFDRADTRPQAAQEAKPNQSPTQPSNQNGNFWNYFYNLNDYWYRSPPPPSPPPFFPRPPPPSTFQRPNNYPLPLRYEPPLNLGVQSFGPGNMQKTVTETTLQYNGAVNKPFQAETSAIQSAFSPPKAILSYPAAANPVGTYEARMSNENQQGSTVLSFIDGKPFAIRRVVNRFPGARPFLPSLFASKFLPKFGQTISRGNIKGAAQPQSRPPVVPAPPSVTQTAPVNKYQFNMPAQVPKPSSTSVRHELNRQSAMSSGSSLSPGRYVVSIRGSHTGGEASAIGESLSNARSSGFLASILSSSNNINYPQPSREVQNYYRPQQQGIQNKYKPLSSYMKLKSPSLVNLPQTDRALIRAKVLRPDYIAKPQPPLVNKGTTTGQVRGKVVYLARNAFSRLPSWYRPKIGPALVRYVVKLPEQSRYPSILNVRPQQAGKKQMLLQPSRPKDLWSRIYNIYNNRVQGFPVSEILKRPIAGNINYYVSVPKRQPVNLLQKGVQRSIFSAGNKHYGPPMLSSSKAIYPRPLLPAIQKSRVFQRAPQRPVKHPSIPLTNVYSVNAPQIRIRYAYPTNNHTKVITNSIVRAQVHQPFGNVNQNQAVNNKLSNSFAKQIQNNKRIPPELWDKRYQIPTQNALPYKPSPLMGLKIQQRFPFQMPKKSNIQPNTFTMTRANEHYQLPFQIVKKSRAPSRPLPTVRWNTRYQPSYQMAGKSGIPFRPNPVTNWNTLYQYPFKIAKKIDIPSRSLPIPGWNTRYQPSLQLARKNHIPSRPEPVTNWNAQYQIPFNISKKSNIPSKPLPQPSWGTLRRKRSYQIKMSPKVKRPPKIKRSLASSRLSKLHKQIRNRIIPKGIQKRLKRRHIQEKNLETELSEPLKDQHTHNKRHVWFQYQEW